MKLSRLSIDLPIELHNELNTLLGGWRIKRALYHKITEDLVKTLNRLTPKERTQFLVGIIDGFVSLGDFSSITPKDTNEVKDKSKAENEDKTFASHRR